MAKNSKLGKNVKAIYIKHDLTETLKALVKHTTRKIVYINAGLLLNLLPLKLM